LISKPVPEEVHQTDNSSTRSHSRSTVPTKGIYTVTDEELDNIWSSSSSNSTIIQDQSELDSEIKFPNNLNTFPSRHSDNMKSTTSKHNNNLNLNVAEFFNNSNCRIGNSIWNANAGVNEEKVNIIEYNPNSSREYDDNLSQEPNAFSDKEATEDGLSSNIWFINSSVD